MSDIQFLYHPSIKFIVVDHHQINITSQKAFVIASCLACHNAPSTCSFLLDFCHATVHDHIVDHGPYICWGSLYALIVQKVNEGIGDREQVGDFHFGSCAPPGPPPHATCVGVTVVVDKSLCVVHV
jgi:hypothetical protein